MCACVRVCGAVEIFMHDDANASPASRVLWVYEDREAASTLDEKTRARSVMDRVVDCKVCCAHGRQLLEQPHAV